MTARSPVGLCLALLLLLAFLPGATTGSDVAAADETIEPGLAQTGSDSGFGSGSDSAATTATPGDVEEFVAQQFQIDSPPKAKKGILLFGYCAAIVAASIAGGWLPSVVRLDHTRMQTIISFVGGLMLGIGVFHLLPHSIHGNQSADESVWWMMGGILTMFLLIRCFHFHHHGPLEISTAEEDPCAGHRDHDHDHSGDHDHAHRHDQIPQIPGPPHCHHAHELSWMGMMVGLSLHTLIDGMALAASVQAEATHRAWLSLFGLGTFLAIILHKPLDAVSITALMAGSGWSSRARLLVNISFAAMCPLGALLFAMGIDFFGELREKIVCSALAFSAGVFLCISLSDLLPEMEFHAHNRMRLTSALLAGILLAYGITFLEPAHLH